MRQDWLPWSLSIFGACCAVFVLVQGVLPARSANEQLLSKLARLEGELARTTQSAKDERLALEQKLTQQATDTEEQLKSMQQARAALEVARRDLSQALGRQLKIGAAQLEEHNGELVIGVAHDTMFAPESTALATAGRVLLRELARSMQRLPADQMYEVGGRSSAHQQSIIRFLELVGKIPARQLAAAAASPPSPGGPARRVDIVLKHGK
jgi:hypothetical protein